MSAFPMYGSSGQRVKTGRTILNGHGLLLRALTRERTKYDCMVCDLSV